MSISFESSRLNPRTSKNVDDDDFAKNHVFILQDMYFQVSKMWELTASTPNTLQLAAPFHRNLDYPVWGVPPNEVLKYPGAYGHHYDRIRRADMSYPIIMYNGIVESRKGERFFLSHMVLDGYHRLSRSKMDELVYVNTVYLTYEQLMSCRIN